MNSSERERIRERKAKVRYYRNEANRTGRYPVTTGMNSHKLNSIKRNARLPEVISVASTESYSPTHTASAHTMSAHTLSARTLSARTASARTASRQRRTPSRGISHPRRGTAKKILKKMIKRFGKPRSTKLREI